MGKAKGFTAEVAVWEMKRLFGFIFILSGSKTTPDAGHLNQTDITLSSRLSLPRTLSGIRDPE